MLTRRLLFSFAAILAAALAYANVHKIFGTPRSYVTTETPAVDIPVERIEDSRASSKDAIQVALILDTSGSMSGLIEQAKSQLWNIVNALTEIKRDGQEVDLEIALYEYGNPSKTRDKNQIHKLSGFTTDMDDISELLFSLKTNGGEEYCGAVIDNSLKALDWRNDQSLKMIYIAGNEPFNQGPIKYETVCNQAQDLGISVNTIFCNDANTRDWLSWKDGARVGGGEFVSINHNQKTEYIDTPFDDEIAALNNQLNTTYIPYGKKGSEKYLKQKAQDSNAGKYGKSNMASRAEYKSSKKYKTESWDLISSYEDDKNIINEASSLPDSLSTLTPIELERKILSVQSKREAINKKIKDLGKKRRSFIDKNKTNKKDLESTVIQNIKKKASKKGYVEEKVKND